MPRVRDASFGAAAAAPSAAGLGSLGFQPYPPMPMPSGADSAAPRYQLHILEEHAVAAIGGVCTPGLDRTDEGYIVWISAEGGKRTFIYAKLELSCKLPSGRVIRPCQPPPGVAVDVQLTYAGVRVSKQNKKDVYTACNPSDCDLTRQSTSKGLPLFQLFRAVGKGGLGVGAVSAFEGAAAFLPKFSSDEKSHSPVLELRYRINDISKNHQKNLFRLKVSLVLPAREAAGAREDTVLCSALCSAVNVTSKDLEKLKMNKRKRALNVGSTPTASSTSLVQLDTRSVSSSEASSPITFPSELSPTYALDRSSSMSAAASSGWEPSITNFKRSRSVNDCRQSTPIAMSHSKSSMGLASLDLHVAGPAAGFQASAAGVAMRPLDFSDPVVRKSVPLDVLMQNVFQKIISVSTELQRLRLSQDPARMAAADAFQPMRPPQPPVMSELPSAKTLINASNVGGQYPAKAVTPPSLPTCSSLLATANEKNRVGQSAAGAKGVRQAGQKVKRSHGPSPATPSSSQPAFTAGENVLPPLLPPMSSFTSSPKDDLPCPSSRGGSKEGIKPAPKSRGANKTTPSAQVAPAGPPSSTPASSATAQTRPDSSARDPDRVKAVDRDHLLAATMLLGLSVAS